MTIHILHAGYPLCRFHPGVPRDWPSGHSWVPIEEERVATCHGCIEIAKPKLATQSNNVTPPGAQTLNDRKDGQS